MTGESPFYRKEGGWQNWPENANEKDVLSWFARMIDQFSEFSAVHQSMLKVERTSLAQPSRPLDGSPAERHLDIGLVNYSNANTNSKCH